MSRIDPVSTLAMAFLLALIALTSWARAEEPGATLGLLGGAVMDTMATCGNGPGTRHPPSALC
jgi:hypothetical protein